MEGLTFLLQVFLAGFLCTTTQVDGYIYSGPADTDKDGGCHTEIGFLAVNETSTNYESCAKCDCYPHGFTCQGIGYNVGVFSIPGCKLHELPKCCYQMRSENDPSQNCTDVMCPENN